MCLWTCAVLCLSLSPPPSFLWCAWLAGRYVKPAQSPIDVALHLTFFVFFLFAISPWEICTTIWSLLTTQTFGLPWASRCYNRSGVQVQVLGYTICGPDKMVRSAMKAKCEKHKEKSQETVNSTDFRTVKGCCNWMVAKQLSNTLAINLWHAKKSTQMQETWKVVMGLTKAYQPIIKTRNILFCLKVIWLKWHQVTGMQLITSQVSWQPWANWTETSHFQCWTERETARERDRERGSISDLNGHPLRKNSWRQLTCFVLAFGQSIISCKKG